MLIYKFISLSIHCTNSVVNTQMALTWRWNKYLKESFESLNLRLTSSMPKTTPKSRVWRERRFWWSCQNPGIVTRDLDRRITGIHRFSPETKGTSPLTGHGHREKIRALGPCIADGLRYSGATSSRGPLFLLDTVTELAIGLMRNPNWRKNSGKLEKP